MSRRTDINCGDHDQQKTRVVARQCDTCIYRPGNPVMDARRLDAFEADTADAGGYIVCHSTYPPLGMGPAAVCRGYWLRHRDKVLALILIDKLFGWIFVNPKRVR